MSLIVEATWENLERAAKALKSGFLVGLPTETVYGLAADAQNESAVRRIYKVKGRPSNHPIIVHLGSIEYLEKWALHIPEYAWKLALEFWPGPMTLILKRTKIAKNYVTANQDSVGIRIPNHAIALDILNKFHKYGGLGIAAPSANRFTKISPTTAQDVEYDLGDELSISKDLIIDGGQSQVGIESTIIDCTHSNPIILRPGILTKIDFLKKNIEMEIENKSISIQHSGKQKSHYQPNSKVIVNSFPKPGDGLIAMSSIATPAGVIRLLSPDTLAEFARDYYRALRKGDQLGLNYINVQIPKGNGIQIALEDRILKSAGPKQDRS